MAVTSTIFSLFSRSPLRPLQEHMAKVHHCVEQLLPFFMEILPQAEDSPRDWDNAEAIQHKISVLKNEADDLKVKIKLSLPTSLFLPVNRGDLLGLLEKQDRLASKAKDIAGLVLGRKLAFPEQLSEQVINFLKRSLEASAKANEAIHELDNLLETGFYGREVKLVEKMLENLNHLENETDEMQVAIRHKLYTLEKDLSPIDAMFMYKIVEWIGDLADRAQSVGGQLQLMIAS